MNQKLKISLPQPLPAADSQHIGGPHFDLNRNIADTSVGQAACDITSLAHPQCVGTKLIHDEREQNDEPAKDVSNVLVTVLMPCLNEARTLAACIQQAHAGCQAALAQRVTLPRRASTSGRGGKGPSSSPNPVQSAAHGPTYEILIADNGSTDGSPEIAADSGAEVVHVEQKGYGSALRSGISAARGKYIVMGDSDCSYDFVEVPRFLDKLEEGYDLVVGNRFEGVIMSGAMPWHHRYIGNPILSGIGRFLYKTPIRDWHCGLRAFDRRKMVSLGLACSGMEFASEMLLRATQDKFRVTEIPVSLHPDGHDRPPHLRSIRDGWRHLMLLCLGCLRNWEVKRMD